MFKDVKELLDFVSANSDGEGRYYDYKSGVGWNNGDMKYKLVRSILAMSNIRDGGRIVIGVQKKDNVNGYSPEERLRRT